MKVKLLLTSRRKVIESILLKVVKFTLVFNKNNLQSTFTSQMHLENLLEQVRGAKINNQSKQIIYIMHYMLSDPVVYLC